MKKILYGFISFLTVLMFTSCGTGGGSDKSDGGGDAPEVTYAIGDTGPGGGIVFYITDGGLHGLEVSISDQSSGIRWYNGYNTITAASAIVIGSGSANTETILAAQGDTEISYAAGIALTCSDGGYSDWFLPSKNELNLMYTNLKNAVPSLGGFAGNYYWSSSEYNADTVWMQDFSNGNQVNEGKASALHVRAIREF